VNKMSQRKKNKSSPQKNNKLKIEIEEKFDQEEVMLTEDKSKEVQKLLKKIRRSRKKSGKKKERFEKALQKLCPEDKLLVEIIQTLKICCFNLYLKRNDSVRYLGGGTKSTNMEFAKRLKDWKWSRKKDSSSIIKAFFKFIIEEEIGTPIESHTHRITSSHVIWEISGADLRAVKGLLKNRGVRRLYQTDGIESVKNLAQKLKDMSGRNYPTFLNVDCSSKKGITYHGFVKSSEIYEIREKILRYADENDMTPKESVVALKMKDESFARKYESVMNRLKKMLESIEEVFGSDLLEVM